MCKVLSETTKKVTKITRKVTGIKCDICKKIIPVDEYDKSMYFDVTTGHNDWGNDSWESREHMDICPDCITKFVTEYLQDAAGTSRYIEIETTYAHEYEIQDKED